MDKYEYIVNLAEKTAKRVSQNRESWMKFLTSAARIYKYPFKEQLLIYAQNPDATACASIEIWNKRMNCWVNKGSSGIALPDDTATYGHKFHMQVGSGVYDTRKDAGNAIIKFFQTDADGTAKIGTYLGFSMNIAFDSFNRKFVLRLKGAMNHPVEIGPDPVGNIIRLNNVLKTMPDKLAEAKDRLETLTNQLESAKIEVTKPFQQEEELAEKLKRLAELNALLNMDEKGTDALILEDDEQPAIVNSDMAVTPITSVKTKPMLKKKVVGLCL